MSTRRKTAHDSLAGSLLLAHPGLRDPNFRRSVIFIGAHDMEGAMGVIVNRPTDKRLSGLDGKFAYGPLADVPVFEGGPVQKEQMMLAAWRYQAPGFQILLGMDAGKAGEMIAGGGSTHVRAILGYSGWTAGQLDNELKSGSWMVAPPPRDLFADMDPRTLWRRILRELGDDWRLAADEPEDLGPN